MKPITTIYIDDEEVSLPTKWEICGECKGEGTVSRIPGAITESELDEWYGNSEERYEFIKEYTTPGGMYDMACPDCKGSGKVKVVDEDRLDALVLKVYHQAQSEAYADWAMAEQERRMGA